MFTRPTVHTFRRYLKHFHFAFS